jgi:hypothetical protein
VFSRIVTVLFSFLVFSHVVDMSFYLESFLMRQQMLRTIHKLTRALFFYKTGLNCIGELLNFDSELNCILKCQVRSCMSVSEPICF